VVAQPEQGLGHVHGVALEQVDVQRQPVGRPLRTQLGGPEPQVRPHGVLAGQRLDPGAGQNGVDVAPGRHLVAAERFQRGREPDEPAAVQGQDDLGVQIGA
jgi:hypothetical protein